MTSAHSITAFTLALALGALVPAMAQAPAAPPAAGTGGAGCACGPRHDGDQGGMMGRMADQLKLTDAQKASMKAIMARHKDSMEAGRKAAFAARRAYFEAMKKPDSSPESLKALHRAMGDAEFDRMLEHRTIRQEMRAVLDPGQREQAARMEGRMEGMRMARSGRGGDWGEGPEGRGRGMMGMKGMDPAQAPAATPAP